MPNGMRMGSLFDGSGGFPLAGALAGIEPIWAAEVEPYPIAVTRSRFPQMEHLGSVNEVRGGDVEPVDVITFGSPCQDLSVAGKRAGIQDGQRSSLFFEAIRIIREMREATNGRYPAFAVWENVPGAFSSSRGEDFRCVLKELAQIAGGDVYIPRPAGGKWHHAGEIVGDGYSIAWRVLDARYWGVPQRRKRIYLVADFAGERAGKILFERDGLRGNSPSCGAPGQGAAADTTGSAGRSRGIECLNPWDCQSKRIYQPDGVYPTLPAMENGGANSQAVLYEPKSAMEENWDKSYVKNALRASASKSSHAVVEPMYAMQCNGIDRHAVCYQQTVGALCAADRRGPNSQYVGQNKLVVNPICTDARGNGDGKVCSTVTGDRENRVTDYAAVIVYRSPKIGEYAADGTASTMAARDFKSPRDLVVEHDKPPRRYIVRRLTPLECCRLQGFPDGWGEPERKAEMTNDEAAFWEAVRNTKNRISGKPEKRYAKASIVKWYNNLHTDSAEYKMWATGLRYPARHTCWMGLRQN